MVVKVETYIGYSHSKWSSQSLSCCGICLQGELGSLSSGLNFNLCKRHEGRGTLMTSNG